MSFLEPVTLTGASWAVLEPLGTQHAEGLRAAAGDSDSERLWYTSVPTPERVDEWIDSALGMRAEAGALPFAVRRKADGAVVGSTRFCHVDPVNRRVEIGHTWYARSVRRTGLNTEAKLLLLAHAFDDLDCIAVEFRTHFFNFASRAAIARIGAKQDGILRNHQLAPNGTLRDTVVFSVIDSEWPTVRSHLQFLLSRPAGPSGGGE